MSKVSIVNSPSSPDNKMIYKMVKKAINQLGGIKSIVKPGQTVALKPNVVTGELSGAGVTTDKHIIDAIIKLCKKAEAGDISIVEGSGYFTETKKALELSGINELALENAVKVIDVDNDNLIELKVPNPLIIETIKVSKSFMDADVRINIPVMKTHDQLMVTLGVKNLKGVIPKPIKRYFHHIGVVKAIIDLSKVVPLDLTILDSIVAMEGLGPSFGPKIQLNTIIASTNVWSLDIVASSIMGFDFNELDYLVTAHDHGLIDLNKKIEVIGTPVQKITKKFKRPPTDLEFAEGITVISGGACSACRGTIHSVIYDLNKMNLMGEIRNLLIIVGPNAKLPKDISSTPIIMGRCQKRNENYGCYVSDCPPNNDKMLEAIREVCGI
jgi:uncharacterized protein (DUF362 family)